MMVTIFSGVLHDKAGAEDVILETRSRASYIAAEAHYSTAQFPNNSETLQ